MNTTCTIVIVEVPAGFDIFTVIIVEMRFERMRRMLSSVE